MVVLANVAMVVVALAMVSTVVPAQQRPPLLSEPVIDALAKELSGDRALETIRAISKNHRVRGSRPFRAAAELIAVDEPILRREVPALQRLEGS